MTLELDPTTDPAWTPAELSAIRELLESSVTRIQAELVVLGVDATGDVSAATIEVLHDELDVASQRSELMQDAVQAANAAAILSQIEHVLARLDADLYGICESCSGSIARARLEAFPRATLCMECVA
ncbi:TraR/DksA family transcriptional regulator [Aeromicrobium endophyticum]|uniref:TraR/DksA family transcriptional regulator n=1 Tax=Aeromicrobium endophyticum TaxID=2292704 RepID=A0A371PBJ8_9ACTN|nr:TraR/DksA C4-type zinc finger protein [Aeromicrobium endophyticum]REK72946.1 TraR/DksA family transcriptional regulator [Aeromicrobium endophyticum]